MKREENSLTALYNDVAKVIEKSVIDEKSKVKLIEGFGKLVKELEDELEDGMLSKKYQSRLDLPEDQWLQRPKDMSIGEWFYSRRSKGGSKDEK